MMRKRKWMVLLSVMMWLWLAACGSEPAPTGPAPTPVPTTEPISAVVDAILAANRQDYATADRLLDVSAAATAAEYAATTAYWDWLTSGQRVANVDVAIEERQGDEMLLFVRVENENYPTQQTRLRIRWADTRWATVAE